MYFNTCTHYISGKTEHNYEKNEDLISSSFTVVFQFEDYNLRSHTSFIDYIDEVF